MGVLSPYTLIRTLSLFHLTAAWFFLASPNTIADQNVVFMLGESMGLPHVGTMLKPNESTAFTAVLLFFFGLADLTAASLDALPALEYWLANVPVRLTVLFALTAYSYLCSEFGPLGPALGVGRFLCNSLVFSWAFFELMVWFWIFISLKDERRVVAEKIMEARKAEEDMM